MATVPRKRRFQERPLDALHRAVQAHVSLTGHTESGKSGDDGPAARTGATAARPARRLPPRDTSTGRFHK